MVVIFCVALDIPTNVVIATNTNNQQDKIDFKLQTGIISSALEHATPEQLFNADQLNPLNGFSAVKGLQIASAQGQRIYQITQANASSIMPNINLDVGSETEIMQAINVGREVIVHTDPVSVPGYTGAGYILYDPLTGDGAYKINGGGNGGFMAGAAIGALLIAALIISTASSGTFLFVAAAILVYVAFLTFLVAAVSPTGLIDFQCFFSGLAYGLTIGATAFGLEIIGLSMTILGLASQWSDLPGANECF